MNIQVTTLLLLFLTLALCQSNLTEKNLLLIGNDNILEVLQDQTTADAKPLFLFFMNRDCQECWDHSKDWIRLSTIANRQFSIGRTDCHFDHDVCVMFRVDGFPFILYFAENKVFKYSSEGGLETKDFLEYLSADNFRESRVVIEDF